MCTGVGAERENQSPGKKDLGKTVGRRTHAHVGLRVNRRGDCWSFLSTVTSICRVLSTKQNVTSESRKMSWNTFLIAKL